MATANEPNELVGRSACPYSDTVKNVDRLCVCRLHIVSHILWPVMLLIGRALLLHMRLLCRVGGRLCACRARAACHAGRQCPQR